MGWMSSRATARDLRECTRGWTLPRVSHVRSLADARDDSAVARDDLLRAQGAPRCLRRRGGLVDLRVVVIEGPPEACEVSCHVSPVAIGWNWLQLDRRTALTQKTQALRARRKRSNGLGTFLPKALLKLERPREATASRGSSPFLMTCTKTIPRSFFCVFCAAASAAQRIARQSGSAVQLQQPACPERSGGVPAHSKQHIPLVTGRAADRPRPEQRAVSDTPRDAY